MFSSKVLTCIVPGAMRAQRIRQSGQGMVEYALILVLVAIVVIVILITQGATMQNLFSNISSSLHTDAHM